MSKARDIADLVSAGGILADGAIATTEITGVTSTSAELNILDGVTSTAAELNILVTATASELNALDGITATVTELNYTDGVTSAIQTQVDTKAPTASPTFTGTLAAPTINASTALQIGGTAITSTAAELNILDGVTSTAAELNILDGVTATTAELNFVDGVTSNIQTQIDAVGVSTGHGDVGTYVFAGQTSSAAVAFGATLSGSALRPASIDQGSFDAWNTTLRDIQGYAQSATLTGTWKCMGSAARSGGYQGTLWLRTA